MPKRDDLTNTPRWREIGHELALFANRRSHMGFRLVPKLVTLGDLERPCLCVISRKTAVFRANCVSVKLN